MALWKNGWKIFLCFLWMAPALASEVPPASLTFFGVYGMPVQPLGLAASNADGIGFNILGEWNASKYASLGLSFEQVTFYGNTSFTYPAVNLEGRVFPFENGKDKFSPYVYGGAGLGLSAGSAIQLKAGLGSRVSFVGPLFLDLAVGSHWIQSPASAQYVDVRAGLSYSFGFKEETSKPSPTPAAASSPVATATMAPAVPVASSTPPPVEALPIVSTPAPVISQAPVTTLAQSKQYYKIGMQAFLAGNYALAFKALKKSLTLKEKHKHPYKYAETYSTLGVIYQFHAHKVPNHLQKALVCYKKALAIDPTTKSAKHYYKKLRAQLAKESKTKKKHPPAAPPADSSSAPPSSGATGDSPAPSGTPAP